MGGYTPHAFTWDETISSSYLDVYLFKFTWTLLPFGIVVEPFHIILGN